MPEPIRNPRRKGACRVAFLARVDLIQSLLEAGHSQRAIYDDHLACLGISYSQANRYMRRYTRKPAYARPAQNRIEHIRPHGPVPVADAASRSAEPARETTDPAPQNPARPSASPSGGAGKPKPAFSYDPEARNNRDDLI